MLQVGAITIICGDSDYAIKTLGLGLDARLVLEVWMVLELGLCWRWASDGVGALLELRGGMERGVGSGVATAPADPATGEGGSVLWVHCAVNIHL